MNGQADSIVEVRGLKAAYGEEVVLEGIDFAVRRGEVFVILGGSGCGKSTLLKHMIGLYRPAAGEVWIDGENMTTARGPARRELLARIGVSYQSGALFGSMNLIENIRLPLEEHGRLPVDLMDAIARLKLQLVGLEGFGEYLPAEISGGMKKRAAIARALALDPELLFLDEPSAGLDPISAAELDQLILQLSRRLGITFVVVTHELSSIYTIADRVIMLDKQSRGIVAEGDPRRLRDESEDPWVRRFFRREAD